jgi:hypothetical protein
VNRAAALLALAVAATLTGPAQAGVEAPPKVFDHPYEGTLITVSAPLPWVDGRCKLLGAAEAGHGFQGCSTPMGDTCMIFVSEAGTWVIGGKEQTITAEDVPDLIRHETAHCNGWAHADGPPPS